MQVADIIMFWALKMPMLARKCAIFTKVVKHLSTSGNNQEMLKPEAAILSGDLGLSLSVTKILN